MTFGASHFFSLRCLWLDLVCHILRVVIDLLENKRKGFPTKQKSLFFRSVRHVLLDQWNVCSEILHTSALPISHSREKFFQPKRRWLAVAQERWVTGRSRSSRIPREGALGHGSTGFGSPGPPNQTAHVLCRHKKVLFCRWDGSKLSDHHLRHMWLRLSPWRLRTQLALMLVWLCCCKERKLWINTLKSSSVEHIFGLFVL